MHFAILRNDFMLHSEPGTPFAAAELRQVEINTIAASFGCLSTLAARMHRRCLQLAAPDVIPHLPTNNATRGLADGLKVRGGGGEGKAPCCSPD